KTGANRVIGRRDHDRDDRCRLLCSDACWSCRRNNEIDLQSSELGGELGEALSASLRPAVFDRNIAILNPTELAQSLHKSGDPLALNQRCGAPEGAGGGRLAPRPPRRERPRRRRAAEQRDELAPRHSITSSARASSTAHRGNRASLWNWLELQFVGGRIDEPEFGVGLLRNRSAEKREVFVGVRPVLPIAHSADRISDLIAEAVLQR